MTTNIVMTCHERLRLTTQALESLYAHTKAEDFNLTLIDDSSQDFRVVRLLRDWAAKHSNCTLLRIEKSNHVLARAKNIGVTWSQQTFGRGDWLYLSDSDVWFSPDWLSRLTQMARDSELSGRGLCGLFGGQIHPFHHPIPPKPNADGVYDFVLDAADVKASRWREHSMLDGPSWLMRWKTWRELRGLKGQTAGACQGEDVDFCHRLTAASGRIGVIHPHVVIHTGLTQSNGKDAPGRKEREAMIPQGVLAE